MISDEVIKEIWENAPIVDGLKKDVYRLDPCGALIKRDKLNDRTNDYGWEIDHVFPKALLLENHVPEELIDDIINLRPMHWKNNDSKGLDYPEYRSCVTFDESTLDVTAQDEDTIDEIAKNEDTLDETAKDEGTLDVTAQDEDTIDEIAKNEGTLDETAKDEDSLDETTKKTENCKKVGSNKETDDIYEVYEELQKKLKSMYSKFFEDDLKFQFFD